VYRSVYMRNIKPTYDEVSRFYIVRYGQDISYTFVFSSVYV